MGRFANNWREWVSRYGWAELCGLATSYLGYFAGAQFSGSAAAGAYSASAGENVGYYGCLIWREIASRLASGERLSGAMLVRTARDLLYEFGLPETLDFLIVRPASTFGAVHLFGRGAGVLIGKVVADVFFYALTVTFYERRKNREANR